MLTRRQLLLASSAALFSSPAAAAVTITYHDEHRTGRLPAHVVKVLRAHEQTCDSSCRYHAPDVERSRVLRYQRTRNKYYIWTHVDAFKEAKMYMRVNVTERPHSTLFRIATPSAEELRQLQKREQLEHQPVLDSVELTIRVDAPQPKTGNLTHIDYAVEAKASGVLSMFGGMIRRSLRQNARAFFANVDQ